MLDASLQKVLEALARTARSVGSNISVALIAVDNETAIAGAGRLRPIISTTDAPGRST